MFNINCMHKWERYSHPLGNYLQFSRLKNELHYYPIIQILHKKDQLAAMSLISLALDIKECQYIVLKSLDTMECHLPP